LNAGSYDVMSFAENRIILVEGKGEERYLRDSMAKATSQAIALSEVTGSVQFVHVAKMLA
jgi:hypothetical protein